MTEEEWMEGSDPLEMLQFLQSSKSDRKEKLFECACCRRIWQELKDERSRRAIVIAELHADGAVTDAELLRIPLMKHGIKKSKEN